MLVIKMMLVVYGVSSICTRQWDLFFKTYLNVKNNKWIDLYVHISDTQTQNKPANRAVD